MKLLLVESKSAPLYHFTRLKSFKAILDSNILRANYNIRTQKAGEDKKPFISLTRDINRSFIPSSESLVSPSVGFRLDGMKLSSKYGRKLKPTVNPAVGSRYESEERIEGSIDNLDQYITALIYATNDSTVLKKVPSWLSKDPLTLFGYALYQSRFGTQLVNAAKQLNVPIIFKRKEYSAEEVEAAYKKVFSYYEF